MIPAKEQKQLFDRLIEIVDIPNICYDQECDYTLLSNCKSEIIQMLSCMKGDDMPQRFNLEETNGICRQYKGIYMRVAKDILIGTIQTVEQMYSAVESYTSNYRSQIKK